MPELEYRYFAELIRLERAQNHELKLLIKGQMDEIKERAQGLMGSKNAGQLDEKNQSIFYSSWHYSAVQLASGIESLQTLDAVSSKFSLDPTTTKKIFEFLVEIGFCTIEGERFKVGTRRTRLDQKSPLRSRHHANWRLKAIDQFNVNSTDEIFYTFPMRIDSLTFSKLRGLVLNLIEQSDDLVSKSGNETLACLNIDWFKF